jgi:hypothetical protein
MVIDGLLMEDKMRRKVSWFTSFLWTLSLSLHAFNLLMEFIEKDRFLNGIFGQNRNKKF